MLRSRWGLLLCDTAKIEKEAAEEKGKYCWLGPVLVNVACSLAATFYMRTKPSLRVMQPREHGCSVHGCRPQLPSLCALACVLASWRLGLGPTCALKGCRLCAAH